MNKKIYRSKDIPPLEFASQKDAVIRYQFIWIIASILASSITIFNIVVFPILYPYIKQANIPYSNWFIATTNVPIVLFVIAIIVYTLPIFPLKKSNTDDNLFWGKDFIKTAKELYNPTTIGYKINGYFRTISLLLGIPIFIANIVLILVGMFLFMLP